MAEQVGDDRGDAGDSVAESRKPVAAEPSASPMPSTVTEPAPEPVSADRSVVDSVKAHLPVWKHQFFADGTDQWVNSA